MPNLGWPAASSACARRRRVSSSRSRGGNRRSTLSTCSLAQLPLAGARRSQALMGWDPAKGAHLKFSAGLCRRAGGLPGSVPLHAHSATKRLAGQSTERSPQELKPFRKQLKEATTEDSLPPDKPSHPPKTGGEHGGGGNRGNSRPRAATEQLPLPTTQPPSTPSVHPPSPPPDRFNPSTSTPSTPSQCPGGRVQGLQRVALQQGRGSAGPSLRCKKVTPRPKSPLPSYPSREQTR